MYRHCKKLVDTMQQQLMVIAERDRQDDQALSDRMDALNLSQSLFVMLKRSNDHVNNVQTGYDDYLRAGRACSHHAAMLGDTWPDQVFELVAQLAHCQRMIATENLNTTIKDMARHIDAINAIIEKNIKE